MPAYNYYPTKIFISRLKKIKRKDPPGHNRSHEVIFFEVYHKNELKKLKDTDL